MVGVHRTFDEDVLAPGPEERCACHAAVPARPGRQRADLDPRPVERVSGPSRQLSARPAGEDRLVHADADVMRPGVDPGVRRAARGCWRSAASARCCRRPTTISCASTWRRWASSTSTPARRRSTPCSSTHGSRTSSRSPGRRRCARASAAGPSFVLSVGGFNPRFRPAGQVPAARARHHRIELGQQPAPDLRGLLRDHLEHGPVRRDALRSMPRRRLQRRGRGRLRRARAARAAALHRRLPGAAAAQARLAQPVHGGAEGRARRARGRCASAARRPSRSCGATSACASTPRW